MNKKDYEKGRGEIIEKLDKVRTAADKAATQLTQARKMEAVLENELTFFDLDNGRDEKIPDKPKRDEDGNLVR